jgi:hypothetical protein
MATVDLVASTVLAKAASLLNDTARTVYTYAAVLPYLQVALQELQEHFELNNIQATQLSSAVINILAGQTQIAYNVGPALPELPDDMIEPQQLWEREQNIDPFIPMSRRDYIPHSLEGTPTSQFSFFVWENNTIKFLPSNRNNDIKIDYIKDLFTPLVDENSLINCINGATFLEYRAAALCAEFIERNQTNANALNAYAVMGLDRATGIGVKGKQSIPTRRRPFRASYKKRGFMT